jgi:PKD repeat protein
MLARNLLSLAHLLGALAAGVSHDPNPIVTFQTPGLKTITLTVCNAGSCSTATRQILVLGALPVIKAVEVAPKRIEIGSTVLLEASATGQPHLSYVWEILRGGVLEALRTGAATDWNTAGSSPGFYTVALSVSNASGFAAASQDLFLLPAAGTSFFTIPACRLLDTRRSAPLRSADPPRILQVGGACSVPLGARAVAANLTVVGSTASGYVSVYPGDYSRPLVSSINFRSGAARANFGVFPLSTDGNAQLAAKAILAQAGAVDLIVDLAGYFLATSQPVQPLTFQARLCPFGFCSFASGTPIFFSQAFSSRPALYRYDWIGDGSFGPSASAPVTSHAYLLPGIYTPTLQVVSPDGSVFTLTHVAPIVINPGSPELLPQPPAGVQATFSGFTTFSSVDPTLVGSLLAYILAAGPPPPNLLGYNAYVSKNGGSRRFAGAVRPDLPASEPLVIPVSGPFDQMVLTLSAVNFAGEGPPSPAVALSHP